MKDFYSIYVECNNCDYTGEEKITRSVRVSNHICPKCGCYSLFKKDILNITPSEFPSTLNNNL
jgi:hypothetical protein